MNNIATIFSKNKNLLTQLISDIDNYLSKNIKLETLRSYKAGLRDIRKNLYKNETLVMIFSDNSEFIFDYDNYR